MDAFELSVILLSVLFLVFATLSLERENLVHAVISITVSSIALGTLFFFVGAIYAALLQWILYGGVMLFLFLSVIALVEQESEKGSVAGSTSRRDDRKTA